MRVSVVAALGMIAAADAAPLPQDLKLTVSADGQTQTLNLHKRTARTGDFILYTWDAANGYQIQPTPEVRTFRGTVTENPNALVIAFIDTNGKLTAHCFDREYAQNQRWKLSAVDVTAQLGNPATPAPMPTQPVAAPRDGSTGIPKIGPKVPTGTSPGGVPYGEVVEYELGMDLFVAAYTRAGQNVENTLGADELNALLYEQQMERDMLVRVVLPVTVVRKENFYPTDPGTGSLTTLRAEWLKEPLYSKHWDGVWGTEGGVANSWAIGKDENSVALGAVFHENMHNWGAFHLAYQADGMGGNQPSVGPMTVQVMRAKRKEAIDEGKLPIAQPYTDPLPPYTHVDAARTTVNAAIDIDVLANDMDANGDTLTVSSFTATTVPGGVVTLNADGTLHYVPPAGYQGKDMIVYTAQDDSPMHLKTREVVHIEVTGTDLTARYKFDETSGTTASEASGGPSALLNGNTFSASSVNSPMGKGVRAWGYQNNDDIENGNWSGIILGANNVMPVTLLPDNAGIHFTPFESQYNAYSAGFDIMDGNYTFSTWFRCDDLAANGDLGSPGYVVSKWWHPETRVGWDMQIVNKQLTLHWRIFDGSLGIRTLTAPVYPFSNGGWYHLTASFDRAAGEIRLYVNGTKVATQTSAFPSNGVIFNGRAPLCLGTFANGLYCYSDTRIHAKALSDVEVQTAFAEAAPGAPRLLDSSLSVSAIAGNPLKQNVTGSVWNGGDNNATYSILNGPAWLAINSSGELTGTPGYADAATATATVRVTDASGHFADLPVNLTVVTKGVAARYYSGTNGSVASLTALPSYPSSPYKTIALGDFRIPTNTGDSYGVDARAWLTPTVSGNYTFWIASDDSSELWLSSDENSSGAVRIAYLSGYTGVENWTANPSQQSVTIPLVAGHRYFIKSLFSEGSGGDHMEVAWAGPGIARQVIPQANLIPCRADTSSLRARWKMDDAAGTTVTDSSGNGANGTITGTDSWTTAGKIDGALQLTGATSAVNINQPDISGEWTASMWVMRKSNARSESRLMNSPTASLRLEQYNGTHKVGVTKYGASDLASGYTAPLDTWVHLTFVGNGTDTRLYVNGAFQYTFPLVTPCPMTTLGYSVEGMMDEVQVYNRALTPAEVNSVYQFSAPVPPTAPIAANDTASGRQDAVIVADPLLNDTDANGDTLAIQSFTQGAHGTVIQSGIYLHYTPDPDWAGAGTDTFSYTVTDGKGGVTTATVTVNVTPVNHQPVFTANPITGSAATLNQPYAATLAGSAYDTFATETLTFSKISGPAWLNVAPSGVLSGTPTNGDYGSASFVVRATDTRGVFAEAVLNIAVTLTSNNGVWSDPAGGVWLTASGWNGGTIASGADKTADFSTLNLTANATVTLAGPLTLGGLTFGDTTPSHDWTLAASGAGQLTLSVTSGTPTITVNNRTATISTVIAGSQGLLKLGAGTLRLTAANTYTGLTTVYGGSGASTLVLANPAGPAIQGDVFIGKPGASGGGGMLQLGADNQLTANSRVTFDHAFGSQHAYFKLNGFSTSVAGLQNGGADLGGEVQNGAATDSTLTLAGAGNYTFGPTNGYHGVISNGSTGKLHLVKSGAGTQTLTGANTYTGATTINGGTLSVTGSLAAGSAVSVNSTGTLTGTGTVGGAVTVAAGGTLVPGVNAIGTLTINNALGLAGMTRMEISKTGSTLSSDKISGLTTLTCGGTLTVSNIGAGTLALGDSFRLFVATTYAGSFSAVNLPTPPSGLTWDTSLLTVDGTISLRALTGQESWRLANFGTIMNTGNATDNADPDGDGVANLLEYAFGTDPAGTDSSSAQPTVSASGDNLVLSYFRSTSATGLTFTVEQSVDMTNWSAVTATPTVTPAGPGLEFVQVATPVAGRPSLMLRLRVTAQ